VLLLIIDPLAGTEGEPAVGGTVSRVMLMNPPERYAQFPAASLHFKYTCLTPSPAVSVHDLVEAKPYSTQLTPSLLKDMFWAPFAVILSVIVRVLV
jgi:hypothetical protein